MCGGKIQNCFRAKWNHVMRNHPEIFATRILPLLSNPELAQRIGSIAGEAIKKTLRSML